jgi:hypothetical protein
MSDRVEYSGEVVRFLDNSASKVFLFDGTEYMYLPFWFKKTGDKYILERFSFDQLPKELKEELKQIRGE